MTKIIYHNADLDGKASAAVVKSKYPDAELIGINYGDQIDLEQFRGDLVIMVDISLAPSQMKRLNEIAGKFIWIDHHASAMSEMEKADITLRGLCVEGRAACELAWSFFYPDRAVPLGIFLLGRYDVWDHHDPRVLPFQYGARLILDDVESTKWAQLLDNNKDVLDEIRTAGNILYGYVIQDHSNYIANHAAEVYLQTKERNLRCIVINRGVFSSPVTDKFYEEYDAVLSFAMLPTGKWGFRISSNKYNCGAIAQEFGGGGHRAVGGFIIDSIPFVFEHEGLVPEKTHLQPKMHFNHETADSIEWDGIAIKKAIPVHFKIVSEPFSAATAGGIAYGKSGDILMEATSGELYPMPKNLFKETYHILGDSVGEYIGSSFADRKDDCVDTELNNRKTLENRLPEALQTSKTATGGGRLGGETSASQHTVKIGTENFYVAVSFTLKGQDFSRIKQILEKIAASHHNPVLVHGFLPREVVEEKGFSMEVTNALEEVFPKQVSFWMPGDVAIWRDDMADFMLGLSQNKGNGEIYVIGEIKEGVAQEVEAYESRGLEVFKIPLVTQETADMLNTIQPDKKKTTKKSSGKKTSKRR